MHTASKSDTGTLVSNKDFTSKHYWKNRLSGFQFTNYLNHCESSASSDQSVEEGTGEVEIKATKDLENSLFSIAKSDKAAHMVLLSTLSILIQKCSSVTDLVIFNPIYAGSKEGGHQIVPVRLPDYNNKSFVEYLTNVKNNVIKDFNNSNYSLKNILNKNGNPNHTAVVGMCVNGAQMPFLQDTINPGVLFSFDIKDKLSLKISFKANRYQKNRITQLGTLFFNLLQNLIENKHVDLGEVSIITKEEKALVLNEFNDTAWTFDHEDSFCEMFKAQVEKTPDNIAVAHNETSYSYKALFEKVSTLSYAIDSFTSITERNVAVFMPRSTEMLTSILSVFQLGGIYVPIDVDYPQERIQNILEDSEPALILTTQDQAGFLNTFISEQVKVLAVDQIQEDDKLYDLPSYDNDALAYMIYTSGTTGRPKGVMIHHLGMINHLHAKVNDLELTENDVVAQTASPCFDISVWQFLVSLITGGCTYIIDKEKILETQELTKELENGKVTVFESVPSLMSAYVDELSSDENSPMSKLKWMLATGEPLGSSLSAKWYEKFPSVPLLNAYGPTEASDDVTHHIVAAENAAQAKVPVGKPIQNTHIYVVDKNLNMCPIGVSGEICVAGLGVGKGYRNLEEQTAKAFISNPFKADIEETYETVYKTGDWGYYQEDGTVICQGRQDDQVKIRGFRIELGEIEKAISTHHQIQQVVVDVREKEGSKYLAAYYVADKEINSTELKQQVGDQLPEYMVPAYFIHMDRMPVTMNGKADKKALPNPEKLVKKERVMPTNDSEKMLLEVWGEVLKVSDIGITDNFFSIGGDSIKSIQISARLREAGYDLAVKDMFNYPTIEAVALRLKRTENPSDQTPVIGENSITPTQSSFFNTNIAHKNHYSQSVVFDFADRISLEVITTVFGKLQEHHDALRMIFKEENGQIFQVNRAPDAPLAISEYNLTNSSNPEGEITPIADQMNASLDLFNGPLMKLGLFHTSTGSKLIVTIHSLLIDGISWRILIEDAAKLLDQNDKREALTLPLKTDAFLSWNDQLAEYMTTPSFERASAYWNEMTEEVVSSLPRDNAEGTNFSKDIEKVEFKLDKVSTDKLQAQALSAFSNQPSDLLLVALAQTVQTQTGNDSVFVDLEGHGREEVAQDVNITRTVGNFTNTFPVKLSLGQNDLSQVLKETKEMLRNIPNNGFDYPLSDSAFQNGSKANISFNYLGNVDNALASKWFAISKETYGQPNHPDNERIYDWEVLAGVKDGQLSVTLCYGKKQYNKETIEALVSTYEQKVAELVSYCCDYEKSVLTPSDLTYSGLTIDQLDDLQNEHEIGDIYTLSPLQEGLFFHALMDNNEKQYFEQLTCYLQGEVDLKATEQSMNDLMGRHPVLRTNFIHQGLDRPLQMVLKNRKVDFNYYDVRQECKQNEVDRIVNLYQLKDKSRPFNLERDVLMRLNVLQVTDENFVFIWSHHHILMDGWCMGLIINEFKQLYIQNKTGDTATLPAIHPYANYTQWLENRDKEVSTDYWKNYLKGYSSAVALPQIPEYSRAEAAYDQQREELTLDASTTKKLYDIARDNGLTINTVIQSAWSILLSKYNNAQDIAFGSVVSGRPAEIEGIESMVGLFINTVPVRIQMEENTTLKSLFESVQHGAVDSESHHYHALPDIQAVSELGNDLINHILIFENLPIDEHIEKGDSLDGETGFEVTQVEMFEQTNYDLNLVILPADQLNFKIDFNANVYTADTVKSVLNHLEQVIVQVSADAQMPVAEVALTTEEERKQLLHDFNQTTYSYPSEKNLVDLFEEQVDKTPISLALASGADELTYQEVNQKSNQLARKLIETGVAQGDIIGIMLERKAEMIISLLAILKAGATYLPIDPEYPIDRINLIVEESGTKLLLTTPELDNIREKLVVEVAALNVTAEDNYEGNSENLNLTISPDSLAYVIFTSGSTGVPKGIMIEHRNVVNYVHGLEERLDTASFNAILALTTISFDIAVTEILFSLLNGIKIVLASSSDQKSPIALNKLIETHGVDVMQITPSHLKILLNGPTHDFLVAIKTLLVGGESFPPALFKEMATVYQGKIYNMYGPTETTVWSTIQDLTNKDQVDVGQPIINTSIYILNDHNQIQPFGVAGEVCIGGHGLARGYWKNEALTQEKFIQNPYNQEERIYKTGDLGMRMPNGDINILGRIDNQIKIRGFRVELEEIESQLVSHNAITEAVVVAKGTETDKLLAAYYVSDSSLESTELTNYLSDKLPAYMLPTYFVKLEALPLTPNKKVDKKALPSPELKIESNYVAPSNETEEKLTEIWAEILRLDQTLISVNKSFFDIGGHSLKAILLTNKIQKQFEVSVPLNKVFELADIRSIAKFIVTQNKSNFQLVKKGGVKRNYYPLTSAQKALYFLNAFDQDSLAYNQPRAMKIEGELDVERLEATFKDLIARHEMLRTSFKVIDDEPVQVIEEEASIEVQYFRAEEDQVRPILEGLHKPFDLSQGPLLRVGLVEVSENKHYMLVETHHIIIDGMSSEIFMKEIVMLYLGEQLPELNIEFSDYLEYYLSDDYQQEIIDQKDFWINEFSDGIPKLELPTDYVRPKVKSQEGTRLWFDLSREETQQVWSLVNEENSTYFMVMLSLFNILLAKLSGQDDIVVGTAILGRDHDDLENVLGLFANAIPLRNKPQSDMSFKDFLSDLRHRTLNCFDNQGYQYDAQIDELKIDRDPSRHPFFDVMFMVNNYDPKSAGLEIPGMSFQRYGEGLMESKFDLSLMTNEHKDQIHFCFEYCTRLFKEETVARFANYYKQILRSVVNNPDMLLSEIQLITNQEKREMIMNFNNTEWEFDHEKSFYKLFREQVERVPTNIVVAHNNANCTYDELNDKVAQLSAHLTANGFESGKKVVVFMPRGIDMLTSILSIFQLGGVYVPIDTDYPEERISAILEDSGAELILTVGGELNFLTEFCGPSITLLPVDGVNNKDRFYDFPTYTNDHLAYMIYTSGTTGKPKGVMIHHLGMINHLYAKLNDLNLDENDVVAQTASPCFDISVWQYLVALLKGGTTYVIDKERILEPSQLTQELAKGKVTVFESVPSMMTTYLGQLPTDENSPINKLKWMMATGEPLGSNLCVQWYEKFPGVKLINAYGPTEASDDITHHVVELGHQKDFRIPIGKPVQNTHIYILDKDGNLCPVGVNGEICVAGLGVGKGYWNMEEKTQQAFIDNPFQSEIDNDYPTIYKTGDWGYYTEEGTIICLGRTDDQVKIRGFRIELGEIEKVISVMPDIEHCVVDVQESDGNKFIVAYYVAAEEQDANYLKGELLKKLPDYMVPSYFMKLDTIPLTSNGKLDKRSLPELNVEMIQDYVAPGNELEAALVTIWSQVLNIDEARIGVETNFFMIGGHSLNAVELINKTQREFDVRISLRELFNEPTVSAIAKHIEDNTELLPMEETVEAGNVEMMI